MLIFATTIELKYKAKADVESKWEITNLGVPSKIVGIELMISPDSIFISSSKYIESILLKCKVRTHAGLGIDPFDHVTAPATLTHWHHLRMHALSPCPSTALQSTFIPLLSFVLSIFQHIMPQISLLPTLGSSTQQAMRCLKDRELGPSTLV